MSEFSDLFAETGIPALFEAHGQEIVHTPASGEDVTLTAIVGDEETELVDDLEGTKQVRMRQVTICRDPDGDYGGVAEVSVHDTETIDSIIYSVDRIESQDVNTTVMRVRRLGRYEVARPDYRKD